MSQHGASRWQIAPCSIKDSSKESFKGGTSMLHQGLQHVTVCDEVLPTFLTGQMQWKRWKNHGSVD